MDIRMQKKWLPIFVAAALFGGCVDEPASTTTTTGTTESDLTEGNRASIGDIYRLQAAFHLAKTTQDIDLMMSLWAHDAHFVNSGTPYSGTQAIRDFWLGSGSFENRRMSLVPSYKTQIEVHGDKAYLYFECHDIGDYDLATRFIAGDTFLAGTLVKRNGKWLFKDMTAGSAAPLSPDHLYFTE